MFSTSMSRPIAVSCAVLLAVTATAGAAPGSAVVTAPSAAQATPDHASDANHSVTLLTGDVVQVERVGGGRQTVTVQPADGRDAIGFHQLELDGQLHVIPLDVLPHLGSGRIDKALFNVDQLIEQGFHDAASGSLPLILGYGRATSAAQLHAAATPAGAQHETTLESVSSRAVSIEKESATTFWSAVDSAGAAEATLAHGIETIWLDGIVEPTLDRSTGQIGAPDAWNAGLDGTGATVAVLDTGVDQQHPDLAGQVVQARDFSGSGSTLDRLGHGTHVAATIAGTGDASDGTRQGVAPGADLLSGKVLDDAGQGRLSWIIDGMEWAVDAGADVVNLSLGGGTTDGTDPMSLAVDALTERSGTLFVVAAGNDGPGAVSVGSPGSADEALTVGAVDRDDVLADFSSRGPRWGDLALKPDITAPGVGIVAARANGTSLGSPVDQHYTALNGTSMATPHVAGAAAILAQQHPDWTADDLKGALISTAATAEAHTEDQQGGGRVDVARAVEQGVYADGTVHLGTFADDAAKPATTEITYVNTTDDAVELDLGLTLSTAGGEPPADGAVRINQDARRVEANSTASVSVVVDPAVLEKGRYTGYLTATSGDTTVHSTLWLLKEPPVHTVNFTAVGPDGGDVVLAPLVVFGEDPRFDVVTEVAVGVSTELGEGVYHIFADAHHRDDHGKSAHVAIIPELAITEDTDVVIDLRKTVEVEIETPRPARQTGVYSYYAHRDFGSRTVSNGVLQYPGFERLFVTPTDEVTTGEFEFSSRWQLRAPMLAAEVVGRPGLDVDLYYLGYSPALEGTRRLPVVHAGKGEPEDYRGLDVDGAVVLLTPEGDPYWGRLTTEAAEAGAAMAIIVPPGTYSWYNEWNVRGDRLPALGAFIRTYQAGPLLDALKSGPLTMKLTGAVNSPYLYDVMQVSRGRVPDRVVHTVDDTNSATVRSRYHHTGGDDWVKEQRFGWRPWMRSAINQTERELRRPHVREEIISSGDTLWQHRVRHNYPRLIGQPVKAGMTHEPRSYEPGEHTVADWHRPVIRPAIPRDAAAPTSHRDGDVMTIRIPEFTGTSPGSYGRTEELDPSSRTDTVTAELYRDGELLRQRPAAWGDFHTRAADAAYRLDLSVQREQAEWAFSTRTDTSWSFHSARPDDGTELLPLLQLDYDIDTDLRGHAPSGRVVRLNLTARHQDGLTGLDVARMAARVSFDDGDSWEDARLIDKGDGRYQAMVRHPPLRRTNGFVSIEVEAVDSAGNSIEQTVLRAYGLR